MPKVYKTKNNKLAVYIPYDVIDALGIKGGDDLDFLKYGDSTYLLAKKMDIVKLLAKANSDEAKPAESKKVYVPREVTYKNISLEPNELQLLKKLDTIKYNDRTNVKVGAMLNADEKGTLQVLLKKGIIVPFRKAGEKEVRYSIQKSIYDTFLYRKKKEEAPVQNVQMGKPKIAQQAVKVSAPQPKAWEQKITGSEAYMETLETKGFLVLSNEAEASIVSTALEDSIRHGIVLGTRAFNKKFYIGLRGFINKYSQKILKVIDQKSVDVAEIAKEVGLEEDGARTILYVLSESGDVTEVRRDIFKAA
jgi:bifunctional DNA-binding transcriptional regulator/antitoxin component of YhaV-PrlF toxin-antitoxin module